METQKLIVIGAILSFLLKLLYMLCGISADDIKNIILISISVLAKLKKPFGSSRGSHIVCLLCLMSSSINPYYELEYFCLFIFVCLNSKDVLLYDKEYFIIFGLIQLSYDTMNLGLYLVCLKIFYYSRIFVICLLLSNSDVKLEEIRSSSFTLLTGKSKLKQFHSASLNFIVSNQSCFIIGAQPINHNFIYQVKDAVFQAFRSFFKCKDLEIDNPDIMLYKCENQIPQATEKLRFDNEMMQIKEDLLAKCINEMNIGIMIVHPRSYNILYLNKYCKDTLNLDLNGKKLRKFIKISEKNGDENSLHDDCFESQIQGSYSNKYTFEDKLETLYVSIHPVTLNFEPIDTALIRKSSDQTGDSFFKSGMEGKFQPCSKQVRIILMEKSSIVGFFNIKNKIYDVMKSKLLVTVSHELNNPVSGLNFSLEQLKNSRRLTLKESNEISFYYDYIVYFVKMLSLQLKLNFKETILTNTSTFNLTDLLTSTFKSLGQLYKTNRIKLRFLQLMNFKVINVNSDYQLTEMAFKSIFIFIRNVVPRYTKVLVSFSKITSIQNSSNSIVSANSHNFVATFQVANKDENDLEYEHFSSSWNSNIEEEFKISNSVATGEIVENFLNEFCVILNMRFAVITKENFLDSVKLYFAGIEVYEDEELLQAKSLDNSNKDSWKPNFKICVESIKSTNECDLLTYTKNNQIKPHHLSATNDIKCSNNFLSKDSVASVEEIQVEKMHQLYSPNSPILKSKYLTLNYKFGPTVTSLKPTNPKEMIKEELPSSQLQDDFENCFTSDLEEMKDEDKKPRDIGTYEFDKFPAKSSLVKLSSKQGSINLNKGISEISSKFTFNSYNSFDEDNKKPTINNKNISKIIEANSYLKSNIKEDLKQIKNESVAFNSILPEFSIREQISLKNLLVKSSTSSHAVAEKNNPITAYMKEDLKNNELIGVSDESLSKTKRRTNPSNNSKMDLALNSLMIQKKDKRNRLTKQIYLSDNDKGSEENNMTSVKTLHSKASIHGSIISNKNKISHTCNNCEFLVVDDQKPSRSSLMCHLRKIGLSGMEVDSGFKCLEVVKQSDSCSNCKRFKIIFMDIEMPVMDGISCSRELQKHYFAATVKPKIIIVSAHEALAVHNMIKDIPIIDKFLSKPVHKDEFQKVIELSIA